MKIGAAAADRFLAAPPAGVRAFLFYGPDGGLVRERAAALARRHVPDLADPFRVGLLSGAALAEEPARLADEAALLSLTGESRVVRVDAATDRAAAAFEALLARPEAAAPVVAEAGELAPRSRLRRLFEEARDAAAIACYPDEGAGLEALIRASMAEAEIALTGDALGYLAGRLGADRMVTRQELEKLKLYAGGPGTVTLEDAARSCGDSSILTLDDLCDAVAGRDAGRVASGLDRLFEEGVAPVAALRAVQRHMQRLEVCAARVVRGAAPDQAVKALRPPLFFKRVPAFRRALRHWTPRRTGAALAALREAEILCKSGLAPPAPLAANALIALASR